MRHKEKITQLLKEGATYSQIVSQTGASKGTISFHAKRLGMSKPNLYKERYCFKCNSLLPKDASHKRKYCLNCSQSRFSGTCDLCGKNLPGRNRCSACSVQVKRFKIKKRAVEYLGNKCMKCDMVFPLSVYDFHHRDASTKEFGISMRGYCRKWESIVPELDKCDLLCANCHRLETNLTQLKIEKILG